MRTMASKNARRMSAAALAAALLLATASCGGDDDPAVAEPAAPVASEPANQSAEDPEPSPESTILTETEYAPEGTPAEFDQGLQTIEIELVDGEPTERQPNIDIAEGDQFRLVVTSDEKVEIHVHGYDHYLNVQPGQRAALRFLADQTGAWVIEVHETGAELFTLRVR